MECNITAFNSDDCRSLLDIPVILHWLILLNISSWIRTHSSHCHMQLFFGNMAIKIRINLHHNISGVLWCHHNIIPHISIPISDKVCKLVDVKSIGMISIIHSKGMVDIIVYFLFTCKVVHTFKINIAN